MRQEEAWKKRQESTLSEVLGEMGYNAKTDFMAIRIDPYSSKMELNNGMSLGGWETEKRPVRPNARTVEELSVQTKQTYNEALDNQCVNPDGKIAVGITGRNNGVYSAYMAFGKEMIVTENPKIIEALERQMHFESDRMGVPFSNGERPKNFQQNMEWEQVKNYSSKSDKSAKRLLTKEEKAEAKKREEFMKSMEAKFNTPAPAKNPVMEAAMARRNGKGY